VNEIVTCLVFPLQRKAIVTPEIFSQFAQLGLRAPLCIAEIPTAIEQLMVGRGGNFMLSVASYSLCLPS